MEKETSKINQSQVYELITGTEVSWQEIIYDLIRTEQLDPWDIDLAVLAEKYLERIKQMEEESFFVSSKVLLACSLLLRLKADFLAGRFIQGLDEALYGRKEEKKYGLERIQLDEDELPILVPKTPMPRFKRVTLQELISALNKAMDTENRRIKKEIKIKQAEKSALDVLPRTDKIPLKDRITAVFLKIKSYIKHQDTKRIKMTFSELAPTKDEKLAAFLPVLYLSNQEKIYLDQENHFDDIFMLLEKMHVKFMKDAEELLEETEEFWPEDKIERPEEELNMDIKNQ